MASSPKTPIYYPNSEIEVDVGDYLLLNNADFQFPWGKVVKVSQMKGGEGCHITVERSKRQVRITLDAEAEPEVDYWCYPRDIPVRAVAAQRDKCIEQWAYDNENGGLPTLSATDHGQGGRQWVKYICELAVQDEDTGEIHWDWRNQDFDEKNWHREWVDSGPEGAVTVKRIPESESQWLTLAKKVVELPLALRICEAAASDYLPWSRLQDSVQLGTSEDGYPTAEILFYVPLFADSSEDGIEARKKYEAFRSILAWPEKPAPLPKK